MNIPVKVRDERAVYDLADVTFSGAGPAGLG
jgi:hypothetical protein